MNDTTSDLYEIISDFIGSLDNRSDVFLVYNPLVIEKLLYWHKVSWENWLSLMDTPNIKNDWIMIYTQIRQGIKTIGKRSIAAGQYSFTASFSRKFEKHLIENQDVKVENKARRIWLYRDYTYPLFFESVVDFISAKTYEEEYFWKEFPLDWKVTATNLRNRNPFALLSYNNFLGWALSRLANPKEEFDLTLHTFVEDLFPEAAPEVLEIILLFVCTPFDPQARVKSVIERYWTIGYPSLKAVSFVTTIGEGTTEDEITRQRLQKEIEIDEQLKTATKKTYEIAIQLFSNVFTKETLAKSIEEAKKLNYAEDSKEERKRKRILKTLLELEQHVK
jgi:hypothetical protein